MNRAEYNGWTNYETWNVALWLDNDQGSQGYWNETAQEVYNAAKSDTSFTKEERAKLDLADRLKTELEESMPELGASMWSDLLGAALSEVNWQEIAEHYINDVDKSAETVIRPYGPGKFNTILDSYIYSVSLDGGCDEETGESETTGWYGLMRNGRTIFRDHYPCLETLNTAEQKQLTQSAGAIVSEDSQGFVSVEYFDTAERLDDAWRKVLAETEPAEENTES